MHSKHQQTLFLILTHTVCILNKKGNKKLILQQIVVILLDKARHPSSSITSTTPSLRWNKRLSASTQSLAL